MSQYCTPKEKIWDVVGNILVHKTNVPVKCQCSERYGSPAVDDIQQALRNKLVSMAEDAKSENIIFSAKKRREKVWVIEGIVVLQDGTTIPVRYERDERYDSAPEVKNIQDDLRNKLVCMAEDTPDENVFFSAKKRKKERLVVDANVPEETPSFVEHEAAIDPEPIPVPLPGGITIDLPSGRRLYYDIPKCSDPWDVVERHPWGSPPRP